jgi:curved DNA-binding protein CbpA
MDPYQTLGVARDCTREEVKAAFRARVRLAHPDRGGDVESFIQLCAAYKQVLEEVERGLRPKARKRGRGARRRRAARPPDPAWEPELIVAAKPPDPNWEPDLVLHEAAPRAGHPPGPPDPNAAGDPYASWLRRVSGRSARGRTEGPTAQGHTLGLIILVGAVLASIAICWMVWRYVDRMEAEARRTALRGGDETGHSLAGAAARLRIPAIRSVAALPHPERCRRVPGSDADCRIVPPEARSLDAGSGESREDFAA